jgi:type VI secretion system protein ImpH
MATYRRRLHRPLIEELFTEGFRFELVQALALLERAETGRKALGLGTDPDLEAVRIEQDPGLGFPAGDVTTIARAEDGQAVLRTPVMGVSGLSGPLPYAFTEGMLERISRRDRAMAAFLDIFNHRIVSLFYRGRKAVMPVLHPDHSHSVMVRALRAVVGIGMPTLAERLPDLPDRMLLCFAGILGNRRPSTAGLQVALAGMFGIAVAVRNFEGRWVDLPEDARAMLRRPSDRDACTLNGGMAIGRRVWDQHGGIALDLSFDSLEQCEDFLPTGDHSAAMMAVCRFVLGPLVDIIVTISLAASAVPPLRLSRSGRARLGWTSWLLGPSGATKTDGKARLVASRAGMEV